MKLSKPMTEKEAAESGLWKRGTYDFECIDARETTSKKGAPMIALEHRVHDADGKTRTFKDWLLEGEYTSYKVRHFAAAAGLLEQYVAGTLQAVDCMGKTGRLKLGVKKGNEQYPNPQNQITDYLAPGAVEPLVASADPDMDDEIPF